MPFQSDIPMGTPLLGELTGEIDILISAQFRIACSEDALHIELHLPWQGEARVEVEGGEVVAIALAEIEVGTCREGKDARAIEHSGVQSAAVLLVLYHLIVGGKREIEVALGVVVAQLSLVDVSCRQTLLDVEPVFIREVLVDDEGWIDELAVIGCLACECLPKVEMALTSILLRVSLRTHFLSVLVPSVLLAPGVL